MAILIKGMAMPKNCMDCPFRGFDRTGERGNICFINESVTLHAVLDGMDVKFVRMGDCPLIELPPHGRLIDADALMGVIQDYIEEYSNLDEDGMHNLKWCAMKETEMAINDAPTIIEADNTQNMRDESEGADG